MSRSNQDSGGTPMGPPAETEYAPSYAGYVEAAIAPGRSLLSLLRRQLRIVEDSLAGLERDQELFRYEPEKWSMRQMVGHLADCEAVFAFRILAFARQDPSELPGMDQEVWVEGGDFDSVPMRKLLDRWAAERHTLIARLEELEPAAWSRRGIASGGEISVRALAWICAGHVAHHLQIFNERYAPLLGAKSIAESHGDVS